MLSLSVLLFVYVLGGVTFVPLLLAGLIALVVYTSPVVENPGSRTVKYNKIQLDEATAAIKDKPQSATKIYRSGWLTVRRTFEPTVETSSDAGYMESLASSYRSFLDARSKDPKRTRPKDRFFAVLKDSLLFLYEDDQETECWAVIKVTLHDVVIYPEGLIDGELFMKRNAICLRPHAQAGAEGSRDELPSVILRQPVAPVGKAANGAADDKQGQTTTFEDGGNLPWFFFPTINHDKEDWYHSFVLASRLAETSDLTKDASLFDSEDMGRLVEAIDDQPDPIPTRWLNAMLGRLFFSVYRTSAIENYIVRKIVRKLAKVNRPSFLGEIEVKEVNVGASTPFFSKPMLKELTAEGDASMEMHVKYVGEFRITIATVAVINLGTRFKSYSVRLVLAVVLKELEGTVLFKIKRPPSNRIWFGFTSMPRMVLSIEPIVSTRQIKWSMITKPIDSSIRRLVLESIVLPHMDDIAFMNTKSYMHRGGIFSDCARKATDLEPTTQQPVVEDDDEEDADDTNIPPGIPNLKLSESYNGTDGIRQRSKSSSKHADDAASIMSSQSAPSFGDSLSWMKRDKGDKGDKEHSRKRSWFTGSNSSSRSKLPTATESDSHLPLASSTSDGKALSVEPNGENTDGAAMKLRDILDNSKSKPIPTSESSSSLKSANLNASASTVELDASKPSVIVASPHNSPNLSTDALLPPASARSTESQGTTSTALSSEIASIESDSSSIKDKSTRSIPAALFRRTSDKSASSSFSHSSVPSITPLPSTDSNGEPVIPHASPATTSAIFQQWKSKASDKQAIQAGVNQARDAMAKWSSKLQTYRKASQQVPEADIFAKGHDDPFANSIGDPIADVYGVPTHVNSSAAPISISTPSRLHESSPPKDNVSVSPSNYGTSPTSMKFRKEDGDIRSRSGSVISEAGQFKPSAPVATISLSTGETIPGLPPTESPAKDPKAVPSSQIRRVPPPSTVPVHPAFSKKGPATANQGYKPAAMMSIPGIDESRRFAVSSEDYKADSSEPSIPPLPPRPGNAISTKASNGSVAKTDSPSPEAVAASPPKLTAARFQAKARNETQDAPPLPVRPNDSDPMKVSPLPPVVLQPPSPVVAADPPSTDLVAAAPVVQGASP